LFGPVDEPRKRDFKAASYTSNVGETGVIIATLQTAKPGGGYAGFLGEIVTGETCFLSKLSNRLR
jgi:hypothetical protein